MSKKTSGVVKVQFTTSPLERRLKLCPVSYFGFKNEGDLGIVKPRNTVSRGKRTRFQAKKNKTKIKGGCDSRTVRINVTPASFNAHVRLY